MTLFTKTKLGALLLLLFPSLLFAQNGAFWTEDFSSDTGTSLPLDWETDDVSANATQTLWQGCSIPETCPPNTITDNIIRDNFKSSTASNGYAYSYSGDNTNLTEDHFSQLTSPLITLPSDLSGELYLEFQSFVITRYTREHAGTRLYVQADGGAWEEHEIYPDVPSYPNSQSQKTQNANVFFIDLSQYADATDLRLRWEFQGLNEVIWCLDDCKLFDHNPLDIRKIVDLGDFTDGLGDWTIANFPLTGCSWEWEPIGYYGDALLPSGNDNKFINSPTFRTGAVVVNGDYCFTFDDIPMILLENFPPFRSELISPTIDLSSTTDQVLLDFFQLIRKRDNEEVGSIASPFLLSFSTDGGISWSADEPINESFPTNLTYNTHETILLPPSLIGESEVKIKFTFDGKLFYWGLDDISILERAENDMRISKDFFAIPPSYSTPSTQVDSIFFLADIENFGTETQSDIWLHIEIENTDSEAIVYQDSVFIASAEPLELVENRLFNKAFLPPSTPANYKGTYRVESSVVDDVPSNDAVSFEFEVTGKLFAKEYLTSFGFSPPSRDFSWGNAFYMPNGDGFYADSVFFTIANLSDMDGKDIQVELYEWDNFDTDSLTITSDEYTKIAANVIEISEDMPNLIGIPVDISEERVPLKDITKYFVIVRYDRPPDSDKFCFLATSQESDYSAMNFASNVRNDLRYVTMWKSASTETFNIIGVGSGSGFNFIPQIRLQIADSPTSLVEVSEKTEDLSLYPNPARASFAIELPARKQGKVLIYNNLGILIRTINGFSSENNISIKDLPTGTYSIHFIEEKTEQIRVGKLVKM